MVFLLLVCLLGIMLTLLLFVFFFSRLLQQGTGSGQHRGVSSSVSGTKPYQPSAASDIKKATSSGAALASPAEPLRSRCVTVTLHERV